MKKKASDKSIEPLKVHNGGLSTDGADPKKVKALARRLIRPLRREARVLGYALAIHGSRERDIDLIAVPWTDEAAPAEKLASRMRHELKKLYGIKGEVPPNEAKPKPHGRLCWSFWIKSWTYVDLSVFPPQPHVLTPQEVEVVWPPAATPMSVDKAPRAPAPTKMVDG